MKITLQDIFSLSTAVIYYPDRYKSVSSVSIDTRKIKKNSIYVAIKGKNFDGHSFVHEAVKKGAKAVIVNNRKLNEFDEIQVPIISVKNTTTAYAELAAIYRNKHQAKVISITGSNGKTTTKEFLSHLLSAKYKVHKTYANNNNQIGVPLTILSAPLNSDYIILEHGTNHFGEIEFTAKVAQPDIALITNIGTSHTQYLESKEKILDEKSALFNYVKDGGAIFINNDDSLLRKLKKNYSTHYTFGFSRKSTFKGKMIKNKIVDYPTIVIDGLNKSLETTLPLLGRSNANNYLAAVSLALQCGISKSQIIKKTKTLFSPKGRLEKKVFKNFTLIDDTYNSNPESVKTAIEVLSKIKNKKNKILVFGDMFELGKQVEYYHKLIVELIIKARLNTVYTIGKHSKIITASMHDKIHSKHFNKRSQLIKQLTELKLDDAIVLIKGSRGMKMEEFVKVLEERK